LNDEVCTDIQQQVEKGVEDLVIKVGKRRFLKVIF